MRITFVHKSANFSGGNRVVATYAERLQARGHEVCVVSGPDPRPRPLRGLLNKVRGHRYQVGDGRSWLDALPVEHRVLERARPVRAADLPDADVVVATWWETAEAVAALPPRKGAKAYFIQGVEWTIDDMPVERVKQTWRLPLHKIVIAEFMAQLAREEFGDDDLSLVPNAIDAALFHAPPRERNAVPTVGFMEVGPLAIKGGDITRAALRLAKEREPALRALCFGRSAPPPERALSSWVEFHTSPSPEALRSLYASCDVFVHASRAEGFGLPLLEAMACRTPVAATPAGAAPELLPSGGGVLVPHEDPAALADALLQLATLPAAEWRARSDAACARATGYTMDDATERMEAALERAAEKTGTQAHARAAARSDRGPAPALAERLRALAPAASPGPQDTHTRATHTRATHTRATHTRDTHTRDTHTRGQRLPAPDTRTQHAPSPGHAASTYVASSVLARAAALALRDTLTGPGGAPHSSVPRDGFVPEDTVSAGAAELLAALTHPATVAAIEDATGTGRLLLDPHRREQGLFVAGADAPRRSFTQRRHDPPLTRRSTLVLALEDTTLSISHGASLAGRTERLARHTLRAGDALLVSAGLDQLLHTGGLRAVLVPLYQAELTVDPFPRRSERTLPTLSATTTRQVAQTAAEHARVLRAHQRRVVAQLHELLLGHH
ncbi:MAG: glycosyltransferase [Sandaracinaceae bacterium]|nr:glycosyltransferase [Myxococcales bacterium]MCB9656302.1 glycosyltransferase [Sandaracinaceae bacterium]